MLKLAKILDTLSFMLIFSILKRSFLAFLLLCTLSSTTWAQVGFFQGTFDPPHASHEEIARNAIVAGNLKIIYIVAMPDSPGKPDATPYHLRQQMVDLHFGSWPEYRSMDAELFEAFQRGYIEAMFEVLEKRHTDLKLYHVIGSDSVVRFPETQRDHHQRNRGTLLNLRDPGDFIPDDIRNSEHFRQLDEMKQQISSTSIRKAILAGDPHFAIHDEVRKLIDAKFLYATLLCHKVFNH